eukprot:7389191-Prymnesium_polylepis.1
MRRLQEIVSVRMNKINRSRERLENNVWALMEDWFQHRFEASFSHQYGLAWSSVAAKASLHTPAFDQEACGKRIGAMIDGALCDANGFLHTAVLNALSSDSDYARVASVINPLKDWLRVTADAELSVHGIWEVLRMNDDFPRAVNSLSEFNVTAFQRLLVTHPPIRAALLAEVLRPALLPCIGQLGLDWVEARSSVCDALQTKQVMEKFDTNGNLPNRQAREELVPVVERQLLVTLVTPAIARAVGLEEG